eukprot:GEMP01021701.1.p1 GENE.GEMP01021701.1~~GEMP01021701.1.p1  ORF type:complete len:553 (+),score=90.93 GEMP01021701.1:133-1791(+)
MYCSVELFDDQQCQRRSTFTDNDIASKVADKNDEDAQSSRTNNSSSTARGIRSHGQKAFRGIPYGIIQRRFRKAELAPLWEGERDFFKFGPMPPQPFVARQEMMSRLLGADHTKELDAQREFQCLTLNVYAPDKPGVFPVFVYIHGGAFWFGAGSQPYFQTASGHNFTKKYDFVVVTVSFRLGPFGFLKVHDANLGLWDQLLALQWIHKHISRFGGNPDDVTLCGESAGAMCVALHLISPHSQPYFHRAILMSGAFSNVISSEDATIIAQKFAEQCGYGDVMGLHALSEEDITRSEWLFLKKRTCGLMPFQPCIDGDFIPARPYTLLHKVTKPVLMGYNKEEMRFFDVKFPWEGLFDTKSSMLEKLKSHFSKDKLDVDPSISANSFLDDAKNALSADSWRDTYRRVISALFFNVPALVAAELLPVCYVYRWDNDKGFLGPAHATELPLLFDTIFPSTNSLGVARTFLRGCAQGWSDKDRETARAAIQTTFVRFAKGQCAVEPYKKSQKALLLSHEGVKQGDLWSDENEKKFLGICKSIVLKACRPYGTTARL